MDIISTLPPGPIETILCLLPIQEAARTSILSKEWRFHWTKIPKLAFDEDKFQVSTDQDEDYEAPNQRKTMTKRCKFFNAIFQVLLMHEGPIHEFILFVDADDSCVEITQIMCHLSRKYAVKKLTLDISCGYPLLVHLFSMRQLTDLRLIDCYFYTPSILHDGFGSLTSLSFQQSLVATSTLVKLLAYYPQLKNVDIRGVIMDGSSRDTITNLLKCFPLIENLSLCFWTILRFDVDAVLEELLPELLHLKFLYMEDINLLNKDVLPFLAILIQSSPSLEKLKLKLSDKYVKTSEGSNSITLEDYLDIELEHLNEFEIIDMTSKKTELDFVKLILAKAPVLKKVRIFLYDEVTKDEVMKISTILLCYQRASPSVQITIGSSM